MLSSGCPLGKRPAKAFFSRLPLARRALGHAPAGVLLIVGSEQHPCGGLLGQLAGEVLELLQRSGEDSYYAAASEGEAHLLLGDESAAGEALRITRPFITARSFVTWISMTAISLPMRPVIPAIIWALYSQPANMQTGLDAICSQRWLWPIRCNAG